ncbi:hypothetical protein E2562_012823 [Oryza meyeriana var. granulata]|uniref:NAD(+) ADP-ribosyltransferase n=1 Tax=Oryza meyeriana var. granulata TaxID=110450 RepID=A0A6G1DHR4_9ORYZ|nr:hypothetical protein E2562_012823 [Oryza meyeriana var. granulata]
MGYLELQALANSRGLAANGSKKEVIERLLSAISNAGVVTDGADQDKKKIAKDGDDKVKIVTATRKGAAMLDQHIPDHIKMTYHVLQVDDEIYDATMNQTNVGDNNNKFYVIQALGYNADKLPLGKLSKSTIFKGYDVLKRISNVISIADRTQLEQLTGEFYSVIPHDFGFKKMSEFIIDTPEKLKAKLEMIEALGEIEIAIKLLKDDSTDQVALGEMNELLNGDHDANNMPKGKLSTKGVGQTTPNIAESKIIDDGVVVPLGIPKAEPSRRGSLLYNEYIVYNVDQIRMRYALHVNFDFKGR